MQQLINILDGITQKTGQAIRWLALLMVLISCGVVLLRYSFDQPSIAMQEAVMYLHATIFMLGSAYTWQQGGHVRVDVFYRSWSKQRRRWVDRPGIIFLVLPTCLFMLWVSWTYVGNAWAIQERSQEASGLPYIYLLKTLILMLPITLILQAIAELLRSLTATDTGAAQYD